MKLSQMVLILILTVNISYGSIRDANGITNDGIISNNEYGYNVRVSEDSVLTITGGGADDIELKDYSHLDVLSTKTPLSDGNNGGGGIYNIVPSDNSTITFSGGVANYIYVQKDAAAIINGGQVNLIRTAQYEYVGKTITIECCDGWSWLYDNEGEINGITGQWYKYGNDEFSIKFLNIDKPLLTDTYTHVKVVTPEPATIVLLTLGGVIMKRRCV